MRKLIAACLFLLLLLPGPVVAAEIAAAGATVPATEAALVVGYEDIAGLVAERNPVIRSNAEALRAMEYGYESLEDGLALASMSARAFGEMADRIVVDPGDLNSFILKEYFTGQEAAMVNSAVGILDTREDMERTIGRTKLQMEAANLQIIRAAENLYFTYHTLRLQQADLTDGLAMAERQLSVTRLRRELGLAADYDVLAAAAQAKEAANGLDFLTKQTDNVVKNFNLLLGRPYDAPLELAAPPARVSESEEDNGSAPDPAAAEADCYEIRLQKYRLGDKKVALRRLKSENGIRDSDIEDEDNDDERWYNTARQLLSELRSEEEKLNEIIRSYHSGLAQAAQTIADKTAALELEKMKYEQETRKLAQMTLRCELGLLSSLALEGVKSGHAAQARKAQAAEWALLQAESEYNWLCKGLAPAAAGGAAF
ncbi:MAG: hypothetical protein ACOX8W_04255 [bacterium]|jgi:hypothetical protein